MALVIQYANVFFLAAVQRHAHLPGFGEDFRIFNGDLVGHVTRAGSGMAFNDVQRFAVEVARSIEPGLIGELHHVDDQRVALPATDSL